MRYRVYAPAHDKHLDIPLPLMRVLLDGVDQGFYDAETAIITLPGGVEEMRTGLAELGLSVAESDQTLVPSPLALDIVGNLDPDADSIGLASGPVTPQTWKEAITDAQASLKVVELYRQLFTQQRQRAEEAGEEWVRELTGKDDPTEDEKKQALRGLFDTGFPQDGNEGKDDKP